MSRTLLLATGNPHKRREFARLLPGIEVESLPAEVILPEETGSTYRENALLKAHAAFAATGRTAIADDSGIEAEALDGAPGVRSARFGGEDADDATNLALLIERAPAGSALRYVCVIALVGPGGERTFEGHCSGTLAARPRGEGGFGYDPAFLPDDGPDEKTMAELSDQEKDAISHRGRALREFAGWFSGRSHSGGAGS